MAMVRSRTSPHRLQLRLAALKNKYGQKTTAERMFDTAQHVLKPQPGQTYAHASSIPAEAMRALTLGIYGRDAAKSAAANKSAMTRDLASTEADVQQEHEEDRRDDLARYNEQQDFNRAKFDQQQNMQRERMDWDRQKFGSQMGVSQAKMAQQRNYQNQMVDMKRASMEQKARAAAQDQALNPFKGDPQALATWNKIPSSGDRNAFERAYKERGREHAFGMLEDQTKPKVAMAGLGRLIPGNKEPSGKYSMSSSPDKNPDAIMSFNEFAKQVIEEGGSQPNEVIKAGYKRYLERKNRKRTIRSKIRQASTLEDY